MSNKPNRVTFKYRKDQTVEITSQIGFEVVNLNGDSICGTTLHDGATREKALQMLRMVAATTKKEC